MEILRNQVLEPWTRVLNKPSDYHACQSLFARSGIEPESNATFNKILKTGDAASASTSTTATVAGDKVEGRY